MLMSVGVFYMWACPCHSTHMVVRRQLAAVSFPFCCAFWILNLAASAFSCWANLLVPGSDVASAL